MITPVAAEGPAFEMESRYVKLWPATTGSTESDFVIARSTSAFGALMAMGTPVAKHRKSHNNVVFSNKDVFLFTLIAFSGS
jgi:hypothetical protein